MLSPRRQAGPQLECSEKGTSEVGEASCCAHAQCSFVEHREYKVIYRRYASLFFIAGVRGEENELAVLEFMHNAVETFDRYFGNVCELDIMFHLDRAHFILEEMVIAGEMVETNKVNALQPVQLLDRAIGAA